jgi:hypothetical protein
LSTTLVLGILKGIGGFRGSGSYSPKQKIIQKRDKKLLAHHHPHHSILSILSNIPYQGGAIIGVFMIWALKEALLGYIGLLLNAPYKIDRMVWMRLGIIIDYSYLLYFCYQWAIVTKGAKLSGSL